MAKIEHLATINPNKIRTRVMLQNPSVVHTDKKKEKQKKKCRKKIKL